MKMKSLTHIHNRGSVLLVTLVTAAVLGITLASYLTLVSAQSKSVARSKHWNQSLVIAESGVEDALQMVNKFVGTPLLTTWITTHSADNWSKSGNVYTRTGYLDATRTTYYTVSVSNQNTTLNNLVTIRSTGYMPLPAGVASGTTLTRTVVVQAQIDTIFNVAMAALGTIDLNGNGIATDSFDSGDTNYSHNGYYTNTPSKRKAGGDVATNNSITNSIISVGNANIAGHLITGPYGTYAIGPNGSVGDVPWVDAGTKGIKPGYAKNDMNVVFDPVILPSTLWLPTGSAGNPQGGSGTVIVNGISTSYSHVFTIPGDYTVSDNLSIYVGTNVNVRLKVTFNGTYSPSAIYVAGTGANAGTMSAYLTGTGATLNAAHKTQSGKAANMAFYGLPSMIDLKYAGNGEFTGVIYAPDAVFTLNGGGSSTLDFIGSSVTKTVKMNGHYHFHYDENLKKNGPNDGYKAIAWKEL